MLNASRTICPADTTQLSSETPFVVVAPIIYAHMASTFYAWLKRRSAPSLELDKGLHIQRFTRLLTEAGIKFSHVQAKDAEVERDRSEERELEEVFVTYGLEVPTEKLDVEPTQCDILAKFYRDGSVDFKPLLARIQGYR